MGLWYGSYLPFLWFFLLVFSVIYTERVGEKTPGGNETSSGIKSVLIVLDKAAYPIGDDLTLTIINNGSETLLVGASYRFYRLENGRWEELNLGFSFTGIGYAIPLGGNWSQAVPLVAHVSDGTGKLEPLPPGRYLIEKTVIINRGCCGDRSDEMRLSLSSRWSEEVGDQSGDDPPDTLPLRTHGSTS